MMPTMLDSLQHVAPPTDAQLVARSLKEPAHFSEVVERHAEAIFRFVAARIGPVAAEDVVAQTFAVAFDRRERFDRAATSARPWLYGIASNCLHKHRESERRWLERAALEPASSSEPQEPLAEARVDAARLAPDLAAALLTLNPAERDVLLLFALEELTHEQIAKVLGIRRGTAKSRLSRGCARLRSQLSHPTSADGGTS